jgi:hypothetical protein
MIIDMPDQKHEWTHWGYDTTCCKHCHVDAYDESLQHARLTGGGEYCNTRIAEKAAYTQYQEDKPKIINEALDKVRSVLREDEYKLLRLNVFAEYRPRDRIIV